MQIYTVAFLGHRDFADFRFAEKKLEMYIQTLLSEKEYVEFLVGRNGAFDQCAASVVRRVKNRYREDNSTLVLLLPYETAEFCNNRESFLQYYDEVAVSQAASAAHPKAAIRIRNREMADRADLIICYVERPYGGAYEAVRYAKMQGKAVYNLAEQ